MTRPTHKPNLADKTLQLLKDGEGKIVLSDQHKNAVLLLGNTGSGKSTLVQWLAGDDSKLIAKEVFKDSGEYLIEDNNRIGNATITSKTIFPELVVDPKTQTAFYDSPGFSDTRSTSFDVATSYFIKKVTDHVEAVKLLFVVGYPSVRKGVDRQDFMTLLRHSTELIRNVDKFAHSIALIVTKVDNQYVKIRKTPTLVSDEKIIEKIAGFLRETLQSLGDRLKDSNISEKDQTFYRNSIKFVTILLSQNDKKTYTRIGIFRRPDEEGPLSELVMFQEGKKQIQLILSENLGFTPKNEHDFGYTISDRSKNDINELVEKLNDNVWNDLGVIVANVDAFYADLVEKMRIKIRSFINNTLDVVEANQGDAQAFQLLLETAHNVGLDLVSKASEANVNYLANLIAKNLAVLNIETCKDEIENILNQGKYFSFLQVVSDSTKLATRSWSTLLQKIVTSISHSRQNIKIEAKSIGEKIRIKINSTVRELVSQFVQSYRKKMLELEIQILPFWLNKEYAALKVIRKEIGNQTSVQEFAIKITNNLFNLDLETSTIAKITSALYNYGKYWSFLQTLRDQNFVSTSNRKLVTKFDGINQFVYDSMIWYAFLDNLYASLSSYDIQRDTTRYNVASLDDWSTVDKTQGIQIIRDNFRQFMNKIEQFKLSGAEQVKEMQITDVQLRELNQLLSLTLKDKFSIHCPHPNRLVIKGDFVKFSDLFTINNRKIKYVCSSKLDSVIIFATNTVFIDSNVEAVGDKLKLVVIAPKWEIIGNRVINMDGVSGNLYLKALDGVQPGSRGYDGMPGLPGGSGGIFLGIGQHIENAISLTISANGGAGGSGQNGGDGKMGLEGKSFDSTNIVPFCSSCLNKNRRVKRHFLAGVIISLFVSLTNCSATSEGGPGGVGGTGGHGGIGGGGGNPGHIQLISLDNGDLTRQGFGQFGSRGDQGKGGKGALHRNDGDDVVVTCELNQDHILKRYFLENVKKNQSTLHGQNGIDGFNAAAEIQPETLVVLPDRQYILNEYKSYLRENLNNANYRFKHHLLIQFHDLLNSQTNIFYDTFGLFAELRSLDAQSHWLNKNDLQSFYRSLLSRIDGYSNSLENDNQIKKVLNYMTAATLGKISNLKSSPSTNLIVDVNEYLNLVEKNIHMLKTVQNKQNKIEFVEMLLNVDYKAKIDHKIREARSIIETHILPEIEHISGQIDSRIDSLIQEIIALQRQNQDQRTELISAQRELQKQLAIRQVFQVLETTHSALAGALMGPAAGVAVGVGVRVTGAAVISASSKKNFELSSSLSFDPYNRHNDQAELATISSVIKEKEDAFAELKTHENRIYSTLAPLLQYATKFLKVTSNMIDQAQSHSQLDLIKWRVQDKLKDVQLEIRKLSKSFTVEGDIVRCVEKFEDVITTLNNIYDRIQTFEEQKNFANYIAKVNEPNLNAQNVTDPELSAVLNKLEIMVRSNLVARQYQSIMDALKQLVFPYALFYLENDKEFELNLDSKTSVQEVALKAAEKIEKIALKVREHRTTIWSYDKYSHSGWFDSDHHSTKPFFIWRNSQYNYTISQLLSGNEIVIKADVRMSEHHDKDAIKINLIEFTFKSPNATIQYELERKLKNFKVEATHLGNSYYRYNGQYYVINSESQTMQYSFEKDVATGVPIHANTVYSKIVDGNLMLSPYAMWKVKLINLTDSVSFRELDNLFSGKIDLELIGRGSYVERNANSLNVDDFYKVDDTLDISDAHEEINFIFYSDQLVEVNRTKRFVENQTNTSQDTVTFLPVTSSATRASSFVDKIKHFYVNTVDKIFEFQQKFARIDQNSNTSFNNSITNSLDINGGLLFGQLIVGLLCGKNNSLANQFSYYSPAQEQSVRIANLSQQILPILNQKNFFEKH